MKYHLVVHKYLNDLTKLCYTVRTSAFYVDYQNTMLNFRAPKINFYEIQINTDLSYQNKSIGHDNVAAKLKAA